MRVLKALMISTVLLMPLGALAQTGPGAPPPGLITVTGEGAVQGAPDMAVLSLGVTTQAPTAVAAMGANTAALAVVLDRLKAAGVAERDLQTSNLTLNPNWTGYDQGAQPVIAGYTASNQLTVRIRDLAGLGAVLDAAIADGANTMNGLTFGLSDPAPATDKARQAAVADARARAELLVGAAGASLGRIVSITEGGGFVQPAPMFKSASAESAAVPVEGGEIATVATVTMVFEIAE